MNAIKRFITWSGRKIEFFYTCLFYKKLNIARILNYFDRRIRIEYIYIYVYIYEIYLFN